MSSTSVAKLHSLSRRRRGKEAEVTFFLRAVPVDEGWTWRLFVRGSTSGTPRLIYSTVRTFPTEEQAAEGGRRALATAWETGLISMVKSRVA
jgi:hypothetical protein